MKLFGVEKIEEYASKHARERDILAAFKRDVCAAVWRNHLDLSKYGSASRDGKTLLKIGSNTRLTAVINYPTADEIKSIRQKPDGSIDIGRVLVVRILTHEEYNQIDWATGKRKPKKG